MFFLILFLLSPFLILFFNITELNFSLTSEVKHVFAFTFEQSFLSALISVVLGFMGSLGLISLQNKKVSKAMEFMALAPCFVPVIFVVFSCLNISSFFKFSLQGLFGIIFVHSLINTGVCSVLFSTALKNKIAVINKLFVLHSKNSFVYVCKFILPLMIKDIVYIFSSVFLFCFTSFSIPLVIGGVQSTTVDLLIYEKILSGELSLAVTLAFVQFLFLALILFLLNSFKGNESSIEVSRIPWPRLSPLIVFAALPFIILCAGFVSPMSFSQNTSFYLKMSLNSLFIALLAGYLMFMFVQFLLAFLPNKFLEFFLQHYTSPSTALTCLAVVIFISSSVVLKLSLFWVYLILFIPFLYKMFLQSFVDQIRPVIKLAKTYGGDRWMIYKVVIFPLSYKVTLLVAFIAAAWVLGDYAVTSVLLGDLSTLALNIKNSMRAYRLDESFGLLMILLLGEGILFIIYRGLLKFGNKEY